MNALQRRFFRVSMNVTRRTYLRGWTGKSARRQERALQLPTGHSGYAGQRVTGAWTPKGDVRHYLYTGVALTFWKMVRRCRSRAAGTLLVCAPP